MKPNIMILCNKHLKYVMAESLHLHSHKVILNDIGSCGICGSRSDVTLYRYRGN